MQRVAKWRNTVLVAALHVHRAGDQREHLQCADVDVSRRFHHDLHAILAPEQFAERAAAAADYGESGTVGSASLADLNPDQSVVPSPQSALDRVQRRDRRVAAGGLETAPAAARLP